MLIGYARVSTQDQNLDAQLDALAGAGCERVFSDKASGAKAARPGLAEAIDHLRAGDTLVVWRLDRLGRAMGHLIETVASLEQRGVGFRSLHESIDTTTANGRLVLHLFGALAEFERNLVVERTQAGLAAARARGRNGGRPPKLDAVQVELLYRLYDGREMPVRQICHVLGISKPTLYGYVQRRQLSELAKAPAQ